MKFMLVRRSDGRVNISLLLSSVKDKKSYMMFIGHDGLERFNTLNPHPDVEYDFKSMRNFVKIIGFDII